MVIVLYFGITQEITGKVTEKIEAGNTANLHTKILERYPGMRSVSFRIALNGKLITGERDLESEDTIAILPPFAGG